MNRLLLLVSALSVVTAAAARADAQVAVAWIVTGRDLERDTAMVAIGLVFNPTPASMRPRTVALASWRVGSADVYLSPLASINVGSGAASAADNANIGLVVTPWLAIGPREILTGDFGAQLTTDKMLDTRLWLGTASVDYRLGGPRGDWTLGVSLGGGIDVGARTRLGAPAESYLRYWPGFALDIAWRERLAWRTSTRWQTIADHDAAVPDGRYVRGGSNLTCRFAGRLAEVGISLRHEYGREPPLFKLLNTFGVGVVLAQ